MRSARGQEEVLVQHGVQCSTLYNYAEASEVQARLLNCLMQSQAYYTGPCIKASTVLKQALTMFCSGKEAPKTAQLTTKSVSNRSVKGLTQIVNRYGIVGSGACTKTPSSVLLIPYM